MFMFSFRSDFKILSYLLLILDFINHVHYCMYDLISFVLF